MQAGLELRREHHIDRPLQLNTAKPFKCFRNYMHRKMRFTFRRRSGMACMFGTIISNLKQFGFESLL